jgi:ABC-type polysaccharide/polyol phosphate export permease
MGRFAQRYDLIRHLVRRDFTLRYHASALGVLWSVLLPLTQLLILVFLFRRVLPLGIEAYPAFLFSALLPWAWLSTCLSSAGSLFLGNRDLVRRPGFAPPVLIVVNTLSNLLTYLVSLPILLAVLVFYDRPLTLALLSSRLRLRLRLSLAHASARHSGRRPCRSPGFGSGVAQSRVVDCRA